MNNNNYLIPANSKRGQLILNLFRPKDLVIFLSGTLTSFLLLMIFSNNLESLLSIVLILLPAIIAGLLVMPIPYKHNFLVFLQTMYEYLTSRQKYIWKGWNILEYGKQNKQ